MAATTCPACGAPLSPGWRVCRHCFLDLEASAGSGRPVYWGGPEPEGTEPDEAQPRQRSRLDISAVAVAALGVATCGYTLLFAPPGGGEGESWAQAFWFLLVGLPAFLTGVAAIAGGLAAADDRAWGRPLGILASVCIALGATYFAFEKTDPSVQLAEWAGPAVQAAAVLAGAALCTTVLLLFWAVRMNAARS